MRRAWLPAIIATICAALQPGVSARLIRVPYDIPLLQDACDAAFSGDTVGVYAGTYYATFAPIRPGVTVRGMEADSTAVRVLPFLQFDPLFTSWPGDEPALLENMELHGAAYQNGAILENGNSHMLLRRCYLYITINTYDAPPIVGATADLTVRQCDVFFRTQWHSRLVMSFGSPTVLFEDCVFDIYHVITHSIGSQTVIELRNNTFLHPWDLELSGEQEFSLYIVNNVFRAGVVCGPTWPLPDTVEWRYNDFVGPWPSPECGYQVGNFTADPLFCDPTHGDYRLQPESPCIGAGENGENVGARRGICWPASTAGGAAPLADDALRISRVVPNPTPGGVTIELAGGRDGTARVGVLDPAGRIVRTLTSDGAAEGARLRWDGCLADGRRAPPGVYYLRLLDGGPGTGARILIVR